MLNLTMMRGAVVIAVLAGLAAPDAGAADGGPRALVGTPAPLFILRTLNPDVAGARYLLRDHVGDVPRQPKRKVLLEFAASWCVPCRPQLSGLKALAGALAKANVGVAVVVIDDAPEGIEVMREVLVDRLRLPFPVVSDRFHVLARRFQVGVLPLSVVVDEKGVIEHVQEGYSDASFTRLRAALGLEAHR